MFTNTIGDPGRGERIAAEVLADDDARAEIVAPITEAILTTTPATPEMETLIAEQVDAILLSPTGAQAFIDPFAGGWARMLGEDDPRPTSFDLVPLTDDIVAAVPGLEAADIPTTRFDVPDVPLPRTAVGWMGDLRDIVANATLVLAGLAAIGFVVGFAIGDRRWVLRKIGLWATFAGAGWVLIPLLLTWAASRWASGADSVIEVAVREGVSGLRTTALILMLAGIACVVASFVPAVNRLLAPREAAPINPADLPVEKRRRSPDQPRPRHRVQTRPAVDDDYRPEPATPQPARPHHPVEPTAEMPEIRRRREAAARLHQPPVPPVTELPVDSPDADRPGDDDLWDFYGPKG